MRFGHRLRGNGERDDSGVHRSSDGTRSRWAPYGLFADDGVSSATVLPVRWILIVSLLAWVVITGMWRLLILLLVVGLAIVAATIAWRGRRRGARSRAGSYESNLPGDSSSGSALDFSHGSAALGSDSSEVHGTAALAVILAALERRAIGATRVEATSAEAMAAGALTESRRLRCGANPSSL